MHRPTPLWRVSVVLLAATTCCLSETISPPAVTVNSTRMVKPAPASTITPTTTPTPEATTPEMPPLIFPKEKASATNTSILNQRRLNQTQIVIVSNNASEEESAAMGPEYHSPGSDKSAIPIHSNPLESNHYETHQEPNPGTVLRPQQPSTRSPPTGTSEPSHEARIQKPSSSLGRMPFLEPSKSAAILAGILASVALLGYVGLFLWRRFLERRYGNREMLVNDDDCYDASDPKNFEL